MKQQMNELLHAELLDRIPCAGRDLRANFLLRCIEVARVTDGFKDPDVSIVIRSRNNAAQLEGLFNDIEAQEYDGEKEVIVVDTESSDGSVQLARQLGATVVSIMQENFSYPKSLNTGFEAANHPWVFSFVDHSKLTNVHTLQTATRWDMSSDVAGAYGTVLPNSNASRTELLGTALILRSYFKEPAAIAKPGLGFMATNCALVRKDAWSEVGGFDEAYGAGGEDGALGNALLQANYQVMHEPALSVFHSHGLGPIKSLQQLRYWMNLSSPQEFSRRKLTRFRDELR